MTNLNLSQIQQLRMQVHLSKSDTGAEPRDLEHILQDVCAVQAQDYNAAILSIWTRSSGLTSYDVGRAISEEHSIIRTWLMRGTLHLAAAEDIGWILSVLGPRFISTTRRRYEDLGLDETTRRKSLTAIQQILAGKGPVPRSDLIRQMGERGFPTQGQAAYHLLHHAGLNGLLCFGPHQNGDETFVLLEEWAQIGTTLIEVDELAEIARRYLRAYAPASDKDLASWSGLTLTKSRAAIDSIRDQLVEVQFNDESLWMLECQEELLSMPSQDDTSVFLLPRYDTYLMGYRNRDLIVPKAHSSQVHPGGGILHPVVLVDGIAVGTWKTDRKKTHQVLTVAPFERLDDAIMDGIETQAKDMARFLDMETRVQIQQT